DGAVPDGGTARPRRPRGRVLVGAGVGLVVVIVCIGAFSGDVQQPTATAARRAGVTPTTATDASTTTTTGAARLHRGDPSLVATPTTPGGRVLAPSPPSPGADAPGPAPPPPPTAPAPPPGSGSATIRVASHGSGLVSVSWQTTGGTSATVTG